MRPGGGDPGRWTPTLPRSPDARGRELFGEGAPEGQGGQGGGGGCRVKGPQREGAAAAGGTPLPTVGASQGRGPALPRPRGTGRSAGEAKSGFSWETTRGRGLGGNWPPKRAPLWSYPGPLQLALGESLSLPPRPARRPKGTSEPDPQKTYLQGRDQFSSALARAVSRAPQAAPPSGRGFRTPRLPALAHWVGPAGAESFHWG